MQVPRERNVSIQLVVATTGVPRDASAHLAVSSRYQLVVNLGSNGLRINPSDNQLRLVYSNKELSLVTIV